MLFSLLSQCFFDFSFGFSCLLSVSLPKGTFFVVFKRFFAKLAVFRRFLGVFRAFFFAFSMFFRIFFWFFLFTVRFSTEGHLFSGFLTVFRKVSRFWSFLGVFRAFSLLSQRFFKIYFGFSCLLSDSLPKNTFFLFFNDFSQS